MIRATRVFVAAAMLVCAATSVSAMTVRYTNAATKVLSPAEKGAIEKIAASIEPDVRRMLPELVRNIVLIVDVGRSVIEETGELGAAVSPGLLRWTVSPDRPGGVMRIIETRLRATLFHETHHLVRGWVSSGGEPVTSFMDLVVAEGLATAFARDGAKVSEPWADYPEATEAWVRELMVLPPEEAWARSTDWMTRHPDGRLWLGYKAGTFIADRALKAGVSHAELATMPTARVLELAGFP